MAEAEQLGGIAVDIEANLQPVEAGVDAAYALLERLIKTPWLIKVDTSELREARTAIKQVADAILTIKKDSAEPAPSTARKLKFEVDAAKIRGDVEDALRSPFKINLEIGNLDQLRSSIGHVPVTMTHGGGGVAAPPAEAPRYVENMIKSTKGLGDAIDGLADSLENALGRAGAQPLGTTGLSQTQKLGRIVDRFGDSMEKILQVDNSPRQRVIGGSMSTRSLVGQGIPEGEAKEIQRVAKEFWRIAGGSGVMGGVRANADQLRSHSGIGPSSPIVQAAVHAVTQATSPMVERAVAAATSKSAGTFAQKLEDIISRPTPHTPSPVGLAGGGVRALDLPAVVKSVIEGNINRRRPLPPAETDFAQKITEAASAAGINFSEFARPRSRTRRGQAGGPKMAGSSVFGSGGQPITDADESQRLVQAVGRLSDNKVDITPLLALASSGVFQRFAYKGEGARGENRSYVELSPDAIEKLRTSRGGVATIGNVRVSRANPMDIIQDLAGRLYGPEGAALAASSTGKQAFSAQLAAGSRLNRQPNVGKDFTGTSGAEYRSGRGGFSEPTVEAALAEIKRLRSLNPATVRATERVLSAQSRGRVASGYGLTAEDTAKSEKDQADLLVQARGIASGNLPHPGIFTDILKGIPTATAGGRGGDRAARNYLSQEFRRRLADVSGEFQLGMETKPDDTGALSVQGNFQSISGKLRQAGMGYLSDTIGGMFGHQSNLEGFLQQDIDRIPEGTGNGRVIQVPITPAQHRVRALRQQRRDEQANLQRRIISAPPPALGEAGLRDPNLISTPSRAERNAPPSEAERTRIARLTDYQATRGKDLSAQIQAELNTTRAALAYVSKITGVEARETVPDIKYAANRGGESTAPRGTTARRNPRLREHYFDIQYAAPAGPSFPGHEPSAPDRAEVLASLASAGLSPEVEAEIRSLFDARTLKGLTQRASGGGRGVLTGQQLREKAAARAKTLGMTLPGAEALGELATPVATGINAKYGYRQFESGWRYEPTVASSGGRGAVSGPPPTSTGGGGGEIFRGGIIDVRIISPLPIPVAFAGSSPATSTSSSSAEASPLSEATAEPGVGASSKIPRRFLSYRKPVQTEFQLPTNPDEIEALVGARSNVNTRQVTVPVATHAARAERVARATATGTGRARTGRMSRETLLGLGIPVPEDYDTPVRLRRGIDPFVARAQASLRTAQGSLPQRALSTSIVQIAENFLGGREGPLAKLSAVQNRLSDVNELANRGQSLRAAQVQAYIPFRTAREQIRGLNAAGAAVPPELARGAAQLTREFVGLQKQSAKNSAALKEASTDVETLAKTAVTGGDVFRNLAAGAVGGVAGGLVGGAVAGIGQTAIQGAALAIGPVIERMTGFQATTSRLTSTLADATVQENGNAKAVIAQAAAQAGLSKANYDAIGPVVQQRVSIEAGNKAIQAQVDLFRTSENITRGGGSGLLSIFNNPNGIPGLTSATGGFLGSAVGATPSTAEQLFGKLPGPDPSDLGGTFRSIQHLMPFFGQPTPTGTSILSPEKFAELGKNLTEFNSQVEKGGGKLHLLADATNEQVDAFARSADAAGAGLAVTAKIRTDRLAAVDKNGQVPQDAFQQFLTSFNTGAQLPDPEILLEGLQRQIQAQVRQMFRARAQNLGNNASSVAISRLAQPQAEFGRGLAAPNAPAFVQQAIANGQSGYAQANESVNTRAQVGTDYLLNNLHVPAGLIGDLSDVGKQIDVITAKDAQLQASATWADYAHNIMLAKQQVSDLAGLTGKAGGSQIGSLERENLLLSRQSQLLGFQQQQRQINFSVAVAKFSAPGATGEERAARIKEAQLSAGVQQKQLNIAEKVGSNQFQITTLVNERSLSNAKYELAKLQRDMKISVTIQLDQQKLAALDARRQAILADVQAYVGTGNQILSAMSDYQAQLESQSAAFYTDLATKVQKTFEIAAGFGFTVTPVANTEGANGTKVQDFGNQNNNRRKVNATGVLGFTRGATDIGIAGEAGTEAVAIIRNPRPFVTPMTGSGDSGGPTIQVIVTGNSVRDDRDLDLLARRIEEKLVRSLGRRASQQGLRPVG